MKIYQAITFAEQAHNGQTRKFSGEPYLIHPLRVAQRICAVTDVPDIICASILHDVVEDTSVSLKDIKKVFGSYVAQLVDELTDPSRPEDGNREQRKAIARAHMDRASPVAKTIKLADRLDNLSDILVVAPSYAALYIEESRLLLEVLTEGHPDLYQELYALVNNQRHTLSKAG